MCWRDIDSAQRWIRLNVNACVDTLTRRRYYRLYSPTPPQSCGGCVCTADHSSTTAIGKRTVAIYLLRSRHLSRMRAEPRTGRRRQAQGASCHDTGRYVRTKARVLIHRYIPYIKCRIRFACGDHRCAIAFAQPARIPAASSTKRRGVSRARQSLVDRRRRIRHPFRGSAPSNMYLIDFKGPQLHLASCIFMLNPRRFLFRLCMRLAKRHESTYLHLLG